MTTTRTDGILYLKEVHFEKKKKKKLLAGLVSVALCCSMGVTGLAAGIAPQSAIDAPIVPDPHTHTYVKTNSETKVYEEFDSKLGKYVKVYEITDTYTCSVCKETTSSTHRTTG